MVFHQTNRNSDRLCSILAPRSYNTTWGWKRFDESQAQCQFIYSVHRNFVFAYLNANTTKSLSEWLTESDINTRCLRNPVADITYSEIALRTSTNHEVQRLHGIIFGGCDQYWSKPIIAFDELGNVPYVHDVTYLRNHAPQFSYQPPDFDSPICNITMGRGSEGPNGYKALTKIRIASENQNKRILCMVYTQSGQHDSRLTSIAETWGPKCDGFFAASNLTDRKIGAVNLSHLGPETYSNMWQKVRSMIQYAYDNYLNDYDFFHVGGDDNYVVVENLRYMVSTGNWKGPWQQDSPLYLGGSMIMHRPKYRLCGGGSGYTLNRVTIKRLVEEHWYRPECGPYARTSLEDYVIAHCLREAFGIQCMDTADNKLGWRYFMWDVDLHVRWRKGMPVNWGPNKLQSDHNITTLEGLDQISDTAVSFHLKTTVKRKIRTTQVPDSGMRRFHAILYNLCNINNRSTTDDDIDNITSKTLI